MRVLNMQKYLNWVFCFEVNMKTVASVWRYWISVYNCIGRVQLYRACIFPLSQFILLYLQEDNKFNPNY
jgi:hypothetical protein